MKKVKDMYRSDDTELTHSFQDACADKNFKEYAYNLNIPEKIMIKYTSSLQDAYIEHQNCSGCKMLEACANSEKGYRYTPSYKNNVITFSFVACNKLQNKMKEDQYKDKIEVFEMSQDIKNASFKEIYKDSKARVPIVKAFKSFIDDYEASKQPKGIYLHGSFGSGKTYLIASLFNEMAKRGVKGTLVYYPEFLRTLKASFQTDYDTKFNNIKKTPLLLFDDIGAENCSNWSRDEVLGPILQYRMENHLPTFFTSNLNLDELESSLSITSSGVDKVKARRIVERIRQLTIQEELISKNRRN